MYKFIKKFLFQFDAEKVHYFSMRCIKLGVSSPLIRHILKNIFRPIQTNPVSICGITFPNIVGLGAGFDKNARHLKELETIGFGFVEVGTVTPLAQAGNEKPRLFRLPADEALLNRMGFNNDGVEAVAKRLQQWKKKKSAMIIGANIGKNKLTANEEAWKDYEICFLALQPHVDYVVVNVSSPNTPGLRDLQTTAFLEKILGNLLQHNRLMPQPKPLFLKLSPDIDSVTLDEIIELCLRLQLHGVIISNTTIHRDGLTTDPATVSKLGSGGISGKPLSTVSTNMVKYVHQKAGDKLTIIASGGIFSSEDANQKLNAGASLVQVWTGFIYEGPTIVKKIVSGTA